MTPFTPYRDLPTQMSFKPGDVLIVFGEVFQRGYVNGLIEEAQKNKMKVIFTTVGRRDGEQALRPLTDSELAEKDQPLINIPLESGFDLCPARSGQRPVDQLQNVKLGEWLNVSLDWSEIEQSVAHGRADFRNRVQKFLELVEPMIDESANVVFVHTMAGGVPRAKIIMPAMNRVFKGHGARFASSEEFWASELGRLCDKSFSEVTAQTFAHLIELSQELREKIQSRGNRVSYVAYGYHGTEIFMKDEYKWQSYSPYLQGFAKLELENIAQKAWSEGISATVFNAPEILTNSSSIFLGVEVALYPLFGAFLNENQSHSLTEKLVLACEQKLKPSHDLEEILKVTNNYFQSDIIKKWTNYEAWPQHNGPDHMALMRETSDFLIDIHQDTKDLMTKDLSEIVFRACGKIMLSEASQPRKPVWWIGHDAVAKTILADH